MTPLSDRDNSVLAGPAFEERWRRRFERYAVASDDDAQIAGWSAAGLAARYRRFIELWNRKENMAEVPSGHWLDAGCGAGTYSRFLAAQQMKVMAVDYSLPTATKARERSPGEVTWAAADVTRLPFRDGCFDGALCLGVMQALQSPQRALSELHRVLRPGGAIWLDALNSKCLPAAAAEQLRRLRRRPPHLRYDTAVTLRLALLASGFSSVELFWVPIMPSGLRAFQHAAESSIMQSVLRSMPLVGQLASHSMLLRAVSARTTGRETTQ